MNSQHHGVPKILMLGLALLGISLVTPVWATEQLAATSEEQSFCEEGHPILVAEGASELGEEAAQGQSGGVQERAVPRLSLRMFKPLSIDPRTGKVTAQSLATGKTVQMQVEPAAIARHKMAVGVPFTVEKFSGDARGNCKCGQYNDGSCYCVPDLKECCGPLHGCPIASCGKRQPIPAFR